MQSGSSDARVFVPGSVAAAIGPTSTAKRGRKQSLVTDVSAMGGLLEEPPYRRPVPGKRGSIMKPNQTALPSSVALPKPTNTGTDHSALATEKTTELVQTNDSRDTADVPTIVGSVMETVGRVSERLSGFATQRDDNVADQSSHNDEDVVTQPARRMSVRDHTKAIHERISQQAESATPQLSTRRRSSTALQAKLASIRSTGVSATPRGRQMSSGSATARRMTDLHGVGETHGPLTERSRAAKQNMMMTSTPSGASSAIQSSEVKLQEEAHPRTTSRHAEGYLQGRIKQRKEMNTPRAVTSPTLSDDGEQVPNLSNPNQQVGRGNMKAAIKHIVPPLLPQDPETEKSSPRAERPPSARVRMPSARAAIATTVAATDHDDVPDAPPKDPSEGVHALLEALTTAREHNHQRKSNNHRHGVRQPFGGRHLAATRLQRAHRRKSLETSTAVAPNLAALSACHASCDDDSRQSCAVHIPGQTDSMNKSTHDGEEFNGDGSVVDRPGRETSRKPRSGHTVYSREQSHDQSPHDLPARSGTPLDTTTEHALALSCSSMLNLASVASAAIPRMVQETGSPTVSMPAESNQASTLDVIPERLAKGMLRWALHRLARRTLLRRRRNESESYEYQYHDHDRRYHGYSRSNHRRHQNIDRHDEGYYEHNHDRHNSHDRHDSHDRRDRHDRRNRRHRHHNEHGSRNNYDKHHHSRNKSKEHIRHNHEHYEDEEDLPSARSMRSTRSTFSLASIKSLRHLGKSSTRRRHHRDHRRGTPTYVDMVPVATDVSISQLPGGVNFSGSDPSVVLGKKVPALDMGLLESSRSSVSSAFDVELYVDEIPAATPAIVAWNVLKNATVQLSQREPRFKCSRAYFGTINTASTAVERPYYAINVVAFEGYERCKFSTDKCNITFEAYYDDHGHIRQRLQVVLTAKVDTKLNLGPSSHLVLRLHGSDDAIATRYFHDQIEEGDDTVLPGMASVSHAPSVPSNLSNDAMKKSLPTLMFTPHLFQSITRPTMPWRLAAKPLSKKLGYAAWQALAAHVQRDWEVYIRLRERFDREYASRLKRLIHK